MQLAATDKTSPFPGLRAFEAEDSHLFFGRDEQVDELLRRLARTKFLAVVGTSGSGKSSLVRAGLVPALHRGYMVSARTRWRAVTTRPRVDPLGELERSLGVETQALRRSSLGLVQTAQDILKADENLLLIIDQFEELFRYIEEKGSDALEASSEFVKLLLTATAQDDVPVYVVLTMRSDYLGECAQFRDLPEMLNNAQYLIPRMTPDQRREAIERPVLARSAVMAPRLVQRLLNEAGDDPHELPLLQHALMRVWQHWSEANTEPIDISELEACGGMAGALDRHAGEIYEGLDKPQRRIARILFQRLTHVGGRETRRFTTLAEISAIASVEESLVSTVVKAFDDFLVQGNTAIDIVHESLIRKWKQLREWAEQEAESAEHYNRLAHAAELHNRGLQGLWRDPELQTTFQRLRSEEWNSAWAERYDRRAGRPKDAFAKAVRFLEHSEREQALQRLIPKPAAIRIFSLAWLARFYQLNVYGDATLSRNASSEMSRAALLLAAILVFDITAWTIMFTLIIQHGELAMRLTVVLAFVIALFPTAVFFQYERLLITMDTSALSQGPLRVFRFVASFALRLTIVIVGALITGAPVTLLVFHDALEQRMHEEGVRHEIVTSLGALRPSDGNTESVSESEQKYFLAAAELRAAENTRSATAAELVRTKFELRIEHYKADQSTLNEERRHALQQRVAIAEQRMRKAEVDLSARRQQLQQLSARFENASAKEEAAINARVKLYDWIRKVYSSSPGAVVTGEQGRAYVDRHYDFFEQLATLDDLYEGRPPRWPNSIVDTKILGQEFGITDASPTGYDATVIRRAVPACYLLALMLPLMALMYKLVMSDELAKYYSSSWQAAMGNVEALAFQRAKELLQADERRSV